MKLSQDKLDIIKKLEKWFKKPKRQYVTIGGYAGTGKTTLLAHFRKKLPKDKKVAFCTYTGKASLVLKNKLKNQTQKGDYIGTIHSLIYSPLLNAKEEIIGWQKKGEIKYDLIIIDEASMVDGEIWRDLLSYKIPIIAAGDHGQLPPIGGKFNLMQEPDLLLTEIHRQAKDNPIIQVSIQARQSGKIKIEKYSDTVRKFDRGEHYSSEIIQELLQGYSDDTLVLCGYNYTRVKLNDYIRGALGFESPEPKVGDKVICLRNNHAKQIFNGMLGKVKSISSEDEKWYYMQIEMEDGRMYQGKVFAEQFGMKTAMNYTQRRKELGDGDIFDFGYALTVHKAQGSQARKVILFEERFSKMDDDQWRKWLYTGVTRAEEELYIFGYG